MRNYGYPGATMMDGTGASFRRLGLIERALAERPETAVLMLGTNDARTNWWDPDLYRDGLTGASRQLLDGGTGRLVLMAPPKAFTGSRGKPGYGSVSDEIVRTQVGPIVSAVASEVGATFVDLYPLTENHPEWYVDSLHLGADGYAAIARHVFERVWGPGL